MDHLCSSNNSGDNKFWIASGIIALTPGCGINRKNDCERFQTYMTHLTQANTSTDQMLLFVSCYKTIMEVPSD